MTGVTVTGPERIHEYFRVTSTTSQSRPAVVAWGWGMEHDVHTIGHTHVLVSYVKNMSQSPMILPSQFRAEKDGTGVSGMNSVTTHAILARRHRVLMFHRIPTVRPTRLTTPPAQDARADGVRVRKRRRGRVLART